MTEIHRTVKNWAKTILAFRDVEQLEAFSYKKQSGKILNGMEFVVEKDTNLDKDQ